MFTTLSAMVVACAMLLPNASVFAASYSQELQDAYNWAYSKGVTTMSPIDNANMYGAITRAEMAKMLSVYATEVLGMTPDTSAACTFSDIASVKGDLHDYIIESCQLGIMGQGISAFRPYDTISRAEFGTALSRVLWGSQYEGGTPYYAKHLDALKAAGIMTQIANAESTKEIRGYVMLMLMRSEGNDAVVDCDDPMTVIACTTNTDACPAACKEAAGDDTDVVVKSGDLAVTATAAAGRKAIINAVSDTDTLKFKTSEEVTITKVVLERYGYSKGADVVNVWLEDEDGNIISNEAKVSTKDDKVTLSIKKDYRVVDGSFNATVVVKLAETVTANGTIGFKVVDAVSTAENLNLDDYAPYEYDMVGYAAATDVTVDARWSDKTYNYEEGEMYEVAKLKVAAGATPISINGFTFKNEKDLKLKDFLDKVEVTLDGEAVKGLDYSVSKDGKLALSFNSVELAAKDKVVFAVSVSLADYDEYGRQVQFSLANNDFKATEKKTGARIQPTIAGAFATYTFAGSKIKLTNEKLGSIEYAQGSEDVVVAEWKITLAEPVEYVGKAHPFVVTATYKSGSDTLSGDLISEMRLLVAGEEYVATKTGSNNTRTFTFPDFEIEESGKVQVVIDLDEYAQAGAVITFDGSFDDAIFSGAEYSDSSSSKVQPDEITGLIGFATKLTVQAGKAWFTNSLSKAVEVLDNDVTTKTVFDGTYTAKKNDVNLTDFLVKADDAVASGVSITFYLYVDGKEVADTRIKAGATTGSDTISKVTVKAGDSVDVRVDAEVSAKKAIAADATEVDLGKFAIALNGEDENENPINTKEVKTVQIKVVGAESIKITDASAARAKDVALRGSEATLAQFTVKPSKWDSAQFDTFACSGTYVSGSYVADDLVVTLGNTELDCAGTDTITCEVNEEIKSAGATVTIKVDDTDKAAGNVKLEVTALNSERLTTPKTFEKYFLDAVVRVEKQARGEATTKFTLSVEVADDLEDGEDEITNLVFYTLSGSDCDVELGAAEPTVEDGDTVTLNNRETAALVCGVSYKIGRATQPTQIIKTTTPDYFKNVPVEGKTSDDLMVYKS